MNNFQFWHDEIADMPQKDEAGYWYDLETGIPYRDDIDYRTGQRRQPCATRSALDSRALAARDIAKKFGGKALKGSRRQKEWAEKIRAEKVRGAPPEVGALMCDPNGLLAHSKFWIENRDRPAHLISKFVVRQRELLAQYEEAKREGRGEDVEAIAQEYNDLTSEWGF